MWIMFCKTEIGMLRNFSDFAGARTFKKIAKSTRMHGLGARDFTVSSFKGKPPRPSWTILFLGCTTLEALNSVDFHRFSVFRRWTPLRLGRLILHLSCLVGPTSSTPAWSFWSPSRYTFAYQGQLRLQEQPPSNGGQRREFRPAAHPWEQKNSNFMVFFVHDGSVILNRCEECKSHPPAWGWQLLVPFPQLRRGCPMRCKCVGRFHKCWHVCW